MENNLVSVIVPVYNVEKYVSKCLNSIINQTYENIEIIVIDDGSSDKSGHIVDEIAKHDKRMKVVHQHNGGLSKARNAGIKMSIGKYITFIDSDDYVSFLYIEHLIKTMSQYDVELVQCDFKIIYEYDKEIINNINSKYSVRVYTNKTVFNTRNAKVIACGKLFNTDLVKQNLFPENRINEDEFFTYKILFKSKKIALISSKDYYYFQSDNSIMRNNSHFIKKDIWDAYKERIVFFENRNEDYLAQVSRKEYCIRLMLQYIKIYNDPKTINDINEFWQEFINIYKYIQKDLRLNKKELLILRTFFVFPNIVSKLIGVLKK